MSIRGWVYIIVNEAMPNILKIGYSTKYPTLRAKELAGTGSPHEFRVLFDVFVEDLRIVEQAAHKMLTSKREGKEWFRCSQSEAIATIRACTKTILIEGNSASEEFQQNYIHYNDITRCCYHDCANTATSSYKGSTYCDEHYKLMRKQRFDFARSILNN